jgi:hypothetical protein
MALLKRKCPDVIRAFSVSLVIARSVRDKAIPPLKEGLDCFASLTMTVQYPIIVL